VGVGAAAGPTVGPRVAVGAVGSREGPEARVGWAGEEGRGGSAAPPPQASAANAKAATARRGSHRRPANGDMVMSYSLNPGF
ncbi:MAG TPA: hypothetical protein VJ256_06000, partial [Dehalococcoidia bacterium]|nr:hypothetical protein [Dehalococcoidia bacterium]